MIFRLQVFLQRVLNAIFHSIIIFFMVKGAMEHDIALEDGLVGGYIFFGNMIYTVYFNFFFLVTCSCVNVFVFVWSVCRHHSVFNRGPRDASVDVDLA